MVVRPTWAYDHVFRLCSQWRKLLHVDVALVPLSALEILLKVHTVLYKLSCIKAEAERLTCLRYFRRVVYAVNVHFDNV
jgi:hypothetical protein